EAHLLFDDATEALRDQIERTARLIRSKGVGVYFVTQAPTDVPSPVLTQLGNGEALITVLSPKGVPTPLAATRLLPPDSLMAPIDEVQFRGTIATSPFQAKYG